MDCNGYPCDDGDTHGMTVLGVPIVRLGVELWERINKDNIFNGAAALAYYLMLALFPGIIFLLSSGAVSPHSGYLQPGHDFVSPDFAGFGCGSPSNRC